MRSSRIAESLIEAALEVRKVSTRDSSSGTPLPSSICSAAFRIAASLTCKDCRCKLPPYIKQIRSFKSKVDLSLISEESLLREQFCGTEDLRDAPHIENPQALHCEYDCPLDTIAPREQFQEQ